MRLTGYRNQGRYRPVEVLRRSGGTKGGDGDPASQEEALMAGAIIIGILAGWLAGKLMSGGGFGLIGDLVLGLVGGVVGRWLFGALNVAGPNGALGALAVATVGAVVLVGIAHAIRRV